MPSPSIAVSDIISGQQKASAIAESGAAELLQKQRTAEEQGEAEARAVEAAGNDAAQISRLKSALTLKNEAINQQAAAAFGTNPEASNAIQYIIGQNILDLRESINASHAKLTDKLATGFFDNPLAYITNQLTLPGEIVKHNAKVDTLERENKTLEELQKRTQDALAINNAIKATTTQDIASLQADEVAQTAAINAAKLRYNAAKDTAQIVNVRLAASQVPFHNLVSAFHSQTEAQNTAIASANLAQRKIEFEAHKKKLDLEIEEMKDKTDVREKFQVQLNAATKKLGFPPLDARMWNTYGDKMRGELMDVIVSAVPGNPTAIDATPARALAKVTSLNAPLSPAIQQNVIKPLRDMHDAITGSTQWQQLSAGLKPEEKEARLNTRLAASIEAAKVNVPDSGGLFSPLRLQATASIPVVAATQIWQQGMKPIADADAKAKILPTSFQQIYSTAVRLLDDKKISIEQFGQEMAVIGNAVVMDRNRINDYNRIGVTVSSNLTTAIKPYEDYFDSGARIDVTSDSAWKNLALRRIAIEPPKELFNIPQAQR